MFRRWRWRKTYEWHLDKIERLHEMPMMKSRDNFELIMSHTLALKTLAGLNKEGAKNG